MRGEAELPGSDDAVKAFLDLPCTDTDPAAHDEDEDEGGRPSSGAAATTSASDHPSVRKRLLLESDWCVCA